MRKTIKRCISLFLLCLLVCSMMVPAFGTETRGSAYFSAHGVDATPIGNGNIAFEFDILATHTMTELGANYIKVYRQNSDGTTTLMWTYNQSNTPGLYTTNSNNKYGRVDYTGTVGNKYFAVISMYCENAAGYESRTRDTYVVTCVA